MEQDCLEVYWCTITNGWSTIATEGSQGSGGCDTLGITLTVRNLTQTCRAPSVPAVLLVPEASALKVQQLVRLRVCCCTSSVRRCTHTATGTQVCSSSWGRGSCVGFVRHMRASADEPAPAQLNAAPASGKRPIMRQRTWCSHTCRGVDRVGGSDLSGSLTCFGFLAFCHHPQSGRTMWARCACTLRRPGPRRCGVRSCTHCMVGTTEAMNLRKSTR